MPEEEKEKKQAAEQIPEEKAVEEKASAGTANEEVTEQNTSSDSEKSAHSDGKSKRELI